MAGVMGFGERLDGIRASVVEGGVSLTVDVHGKLVDLRFERSAMTLRPAELAALVRRLTEQAAAQALAEGMAAVADVVPEGWVVPN